MSKTVYSATIRKTFYGLTSIKTYSVFESILPLQVLGLAPCKRNSDSDCLDDITQCLTVFSNGGTDKDYSYFYFDYISDAEIPSFELQQYDGSNFVSVATLNDDTYGTFYNTGTFTSNPLRAGFKIDWEKVETAFGEGFYKFIANDNSTYAISDLESYPYQLKIFSCDEADRTVKIKVKYRGLYNNFDRNGTPTFFDTTSYDMDDEIRLQGIFEPSFEFETEKTFITLSGGNRLETINRESELYNMYLTDNTYEILRRLWTYGMNSQTIQITDYAKKALYENFIDVECISREAPIIVGANQLEYVDKVPQAQYRLVGNQQIFRSC